jgi:hypothetical protein
VATLEAVDVEAVLRAGGLSDRRLRAVWERLLEPARPGTGSSSSHREPFWSTVRGMGR